MIQCPLCTNWHYKINDEYYCYECGLKKLSTLERGKLYDVSVRKKGNLARMIEVKG